MRKLVLTILSVSLCFSLTAQVTGELNVLDRDLFYFQYTPPNASTDDFEYQRFSGKLNLPSIRKEKFGLYPTLGMDFHKFKYQNDSVDLALSELSEFYNLNLSIFTQYKFSDKWSLNGLFAPFFLSNLAESISSDDLDFNGYVYIERTFMRKKGGYLMLV